MIIAVDFDGTCTTHEFPKVGRDIGAAPVLRRLADEGHKLILWTMRDGDYLNDALKWFSDNGITLYAAQHNPDQSSWTSSPKLYAHAYIDDMAIGCPLIENGVDRPYVDWVKIEQHFYN